MTEIPRDPRKDSINFYAPKSFPHDPTKAPKEEEDERQIGDIADVKKLLAEKKERESDEKEKEKKPGSFMGLDPDTIINREAEEKDPTKNFYGPGHSKDMDDLMRKLE